MTELQTRLLAAVAHQERARQEHLYLLERIDSGEIRATHNDVIEAHTEWLKAKKYAEALAAQYVAVAA